MPELDQPQDYLSTPPRHQTSDPFTSTNVEDEPLGGSFHACPPRSTQPPPAGHTLGGVEDLITLTVASGSSFHASPLRSTQAPPAGHTSKGGKTLIHNCFVSEFLLCAGSSHIPTDVPTAGDFAPTHSTSPSRDPFKRKGVAKPSSPISERTKKELADERLSEIKATRLEALERERSEKEKA
ncbi:hypothetical protein Tco_0116728 [Tanacetum coccineum]